MEWCDKSVCLCFSLCLTAGVPGQGKKTVYPQVYNPNFHGGPNRHNKVCIRRSITPTSMVAPTGTARYGSTGLQAHQGMYPQVYNPNRHSKVCIHRSITPTGTARYVSTGLQAQQGMYPQVYNSNRHTKVCIHRSITPTGTPRYVSAGIFFSCVFRSSEPFILW